MEIKSRKDEIVLNKATGKFEKTSIITSEMTAGELRNYYEHLVRNEKMLTLELNAVRSEIAKINSLLGGADKK